MLDNLLESWPSISKAVIFILLELLGFIFVIRLILFYIPSSSEQNRPLGRIIGLLISLAWAWFYIKTLSAFVLTDEAIRLIFYLVFAVCNFVMVRAFYK